MLSGGSTRITLSPAATVSSPLLAQIGDEGAAVGLHLDAEHQAHAADAFEQMVVVGDHLLERRAQPLAHLADVGQELVVGDDVEHRLARRHRQRVAAVGRAVGADHHAGRRFLGRQAGAHREAAADALGAGQDVGRDAILLIGVERAGAGDAALHLVEHQHQVALVAGLAKALDERLAGRADAALALHRLEQEAGGIVVDRRQRRVEIVELDDLEAGQQRREAVAQLVLIGGADRRHRPPVEGVGEGDQVMLVRVALGMVVAPRGLDRALDRFRAASW